MKTDKQLLLLLLLLLYNFLLFGTIDNCSWRNLNVYVIAVRKYTDTKSHRYSSLLIFHVISDIF